MQFTTQKVNHMLNASRCENLGL